MCHRIGFYEVSVAFGIYHDKARHNAFEFASRDRKRWCGMFRGTRALLEIAPAHAVLPVPIGKPVAVGDIAQRVDCACRPRGKLRPASGLTPEVTRFVQVLLE